MRLTPALLVPAALLTFAACGEKKVEEGPPPVGWVTEDGWAASCWMPVDYDHLAETEGTTARLEARQEALEAMVSQWSGARDDGISFKSSVVEDVEITLLGRPAEIEEVSRRNADFCRKAMGAGVSEDDEVPSTVGDTSEWRSWLSGISAVLTEGECNTPLDYTVFHYLEIGGGWELEIPLCEGDRANLRATERDKYRIADDGPWINAAGDPDQLTLGLEGWPCNQEGCYAGMVIARFTTDTGIETILPVGVQMVYTAPAHGVISVRINDTTFYDNTWYQSGGIIDHTAIEISPAQ